MRLLAILAGLLCGLVAGRVLAQDGRANLVKNGDFESVTDGKPDAWAVAGDNTVEQTLVSDAGRNGGRCAKLICTRITGSGAASHVMLAQYDVVSIKAGKWYRLDFWARQEGIETDAVQIGINQTKPWRGGARNAGSFQPTNEWREYEFQFRADNNVAANASRFQMWHHSVGTLWVDDMVLEEIPRPQITPLDVLESPSGRNLIPNASFECGRAGWGSTGKIRTWGGNLLGLFGEIDSATAADGKNSLKVRLGPDNFPVFYFDYFEMYRDEIKAMTTVNLGWLKLDDGATYTLSAMMKADRPNVKVKMMLQDTGSQDVELTTDWKRYTMTSKARQRYGYIGFELDLPAQGLDQATLWLDAVQLEKADHATDFEPYAPIEVELFTGKPGNVFHVGERVALNALAYNNTDAEAKVRVSLVLTDFFDRPSGEKTAEIAVPPKSSAAATIPLPIDKKGFYRAAAVTESAGIKRTRTIRVLVIEPYREKDSVFAVNHAYPWDELMKLKQDGGTMWTRDWSLKWRDVEPEKGRFDFTETDHQINRPIRLGDQVLGLLPFPSSDWSSTAPADHKADNAYLQKRERVAFMPRDMAEFDNYVAKTVEHYKDRIKYWEIMNEPLYTTYAVPQTFGHKPKDYVALLKHAYETIKRIDPNAQVIGGIANPGGKLFEDIFNEGALDYMDILNTHTYPGVQLPEKTHEKLEDLNRLMDAKGKRKKMWCTEYGYYADDDMPARPMQYEMPFVKTEKLCAAYFIRISAIMFANGTEKLFYHAGTCGRANALNFEGFLFKYEGPRKLYTAMSAMSNIFKADTLPKGRLDAQEDVWAFLFEGPRCAFAMAWALPKAQGRVVLKDDRLKLLDIEGNPIAERQISLSEYPVYIMGVGLKADDVRKGSDIQ